MISESMDDPRFVRFIVLTEAMKSGDAMIEEPIMYHECSDEELQAFRYPTTDAEISIEETISSAKKKMFCFDWIGDSEKLRLWGNWQSNDY